MTAYGKKKQTTQITASRIDMVNTLVQVHNATTTVKSLIRSVTSTATRSIISALWRSLTQWITLFMVRLILIWLATRVVALVKVSTSVILTAIDADCQA